LDENTLRERLAENVGPVEREMLKAHGERGALIEVGPELDLLDVAEAIAEDRGHEVAGWIGDRSLTRPAFEELSGAVYDVLVVQPYVLIKVSTPGDLNG
jgi:hypothetical protein